MAQTAPRTETMNRVLQEGGISFRSLSLWGCLDRFIQDVAWGKLVGLCELVDKVCLNAISETRKAACIMIYIRIYTYEHAQRRYKGDDFQKAPEGEEEAGDHRLSLCR